MKVLPLAAFAFFCAVFVTCGGADLGYASLVAAFSPVPFLAVFAFALIRL